MSEYERTIGKLSLCGTVLINFPSVSAFSINHITLLKVLKVNQLPLELIMNPNNNIQVNSKNRKHVKINNTLSVSLV